jgi:hypothetical protein
LGAFLIGSEEVIDRHTNVLTSPGAGAASFSLSPDGKSLNYEIRVANTTDILFGHLHMAPAGANGGVVVTLRGDRVMGPFGGVYAKGVITSSMLSGQLLGGELTILKEAFRT